MQHIAKQIWVVGAGEAATSTAHALGRLPGVATVRHMATLERLSPHAWAADLVVEMTGGVAPAYDVLQNALGHGAAVIATSPHVFAAHADLLTRAARGQGAFLGASAAGFGPLPALLQGWQASRIWVAPDTAPRALMARVVARQEDSLTAEHHLTARGADMSDRAGKISHARAATLWMTYFGAMGQITPRFSAQPRRGVDRLEWRVMEALRPFGLQLAYTCRIDAEGYATTPVAVPFGHPLAAEYGAGTVIMAETPAGTIITNTPSNPAKNVEANVLTDTAAWLAGQKRATQAPAAINTSHNVLSGCFVDAPYGQRLRVAAGGDIVSEHVSATGRWWGIVNADADALMAVAPDALVLPLVEPFEATNTLRMVG